jgi:hypothetical protein
VTAVGDTLGLLQEALQLAQDLGYRVREEPLGDLPGGAYVVGNTRHVLLNLAHTVSDRLDVLLRALAADPRLTAEPMSRLLAARLAAVTASG